MSRRLASALLLASATLACAELPAPAEVIPLWPGEVPGRQKDIGPERDQTTPDSQLIAGKRVMRLTGVSAPEIHAYPAPAGSANGTAVLVYPGGGFYVLAWDLEGTEVAEWLNSIGVSAFVLKYRVPRRSDEQPWLEPLQDAQRAMSLVRSRSTDWQLDPGRIGVLGFSAGGALSMLNACHDGDRQYAPVDAADKTPYNPNFAVLVYPGGVIDRDGNLHRHLKIDAQAPPMFLAHAGDDRLPVAHSVTAYTALKAAGVPAELHVYPDGGHGFGLRPTADPVTSWPDRATDWLRRQGLLRRRPAFVESFAGKLADAHSAGTPLPQLTAAHPDASLADAYRVQKNFVARRLATGENLAGFKGAVAGAGGQKHFGIPHALSAVLFTSGEIGHSNKPTIDLSENPSTVVETELGFVFDKPVTTELPDVRALKKLLRAVVPVVELPGAATRDTAPVNAADLVARNIGSNHHIVGPPSDPSTVDPDSVSIQLRHGKTAVNTTSGAAAHGGQWRNLLLQVNHAIAQGYTISAGQLVITGALGTIYNAQPGDYTASFGDLGTIEFTLVP